MVGSHRTEVTNRRTPPCFCMASFIARLDGTMITLRSQMLTSVAAVKFSENPCWCDGCRAFTGDLLQVAPQAPESVEEK